VKPQKHLKIEQGEQKFLKTGKTCKAVRAGKIKTFRKRTEVKKNMENARKQYAVTKAVNGAITELMDMDTKQIVPIVSHPKLQHIKGHLWKGVSVIDWSTNKNDTLGKRWINTVFCDTEPFNKVINVHGKWDDGSNYEFDTYIELVATLDEDWFVIARGIDMIRWE
jgi:hypothetical protein